MRIGAMLSIAAGVAVISSVGCSRPAPRASPEITTTDRAAALFTGTRHYKAVGKGPVFQVLPGDASSAEKARIARTGTPEDATLYSNEIAPPQGETCTQ